MESIVYNTDCLEYMKTLPDKAFDLAIVDPPYGDGNSDVGGGEAVWRTFQQVQDGTTSTTSQNRVRRGVPRTGIRGKQYRGF